MSLISESICNSRFRFYCYLDIFSFAWCVGEWSKIVNKLNIADNMSYTIIIIKSFFFNFDKKMVKALIFANALVSAPSIKIPFFMYWVTKIRVESLYFNPTYCLTTKHSLSFWWKQMASKVGVTNRKLSPVSFEVLFHNSALFLYDSVSWCYDSVEIW